MKYKITALIFLLLINYVNAATCETNWVACTDNITLPTNNLSGGITNFYYDFNTLYSNTTYCGDSTLCYNAKDESLVNISARNINVYFWNSSDAINGANYDGPYYYDGGAARPIIVFKRRTCLTGCDNITSKPLVQFCLNNSLNKVNTGSGAIGSPASTLVTSSDFNIYYNRYWTFKDTNNVLYNFTANYADLVAWCDDYPQVELNMTVASGTSGVLWINTLQQPKFFLTVPGLLPAIRQDPDHILGDNYYLPASNGVNYTFILQDTTGGQFYKSYLVVYTNIVDTIGIVHAQQFDETNVQYANLQPNQQYKFIVVGSQSSRDLGAVYLRADNNVMYIVVSRPDLSNNANIWDGLSIGITSSFSTSSITCAINSAQTTNAYFDVYATNTTPYTVIYKSNSLSNTNFTFTTTVTNKNLTYWVRCMTNDTTYHLRKKEENVVLTNSSLYYSGFNTVTNNLESTILGIDKTRFLNFMSVTIAFIIAGLFSAISMGTGAIVFGMSIGLFYMIGYFQTSQLMIGLIIFLAIMLKMSENRFGVVT